MAENVVLQDEVSRWVYGTQFLIGLALVIVSLVMPYPWWLVLSCTGGASIGLAWDAWERQRDRELEVFLHGEPLHGV